MQVKLNIKTDLFYTTEALHELATYIENEVAVDEIKDTLKLQGDHYIADIWLDKEDVDDEPTMELWPYGYSDEELAGYNVVGWPEIQDFMDLEGFAENSYLINDQEGLDIYGSNSYVIHTAWLNENV